MQILTGKEAIELTHRDKKNKLHFGPANTGGAQRGIGITDRREAQRSKPKLTYVLLIAFANSLTAVYKKPDKIQRQRKFGK